MGKVENHGARKYRRNEERNKKGKTPEERKGEGEKKEKKENTRKKINSGNRTEGMKYNRIMKIQ